jgi:hypothetical protein
VAPLPGLGTRTSSCLLKSSNPIENFCAFHNHNNLISQAQSIHSIIQCFLNVVYLLKLVSTPFK